MEAGLVDLHCHLDLFPDFESVITECDQQGIYTLTVTTTPKAWPRNFQLTSKTRHVRAALGLHPQLVAERVSEIKLWDDYLPQARYIGEVGLDASPRYYSSFELQKEVFEHVLSSCANAGGKILSVHSLRAAGTVLNLVEKYLPPSKGTIILHWFTGSKSEMNRAIELGCYFSINSEMTHTERGQNLIANLPADRLLTESDGPFTQLRGAPVKPYDITTVLEAIAINKNTSMEEVKKTVRTNLNSLLQGMAF